MGKRKNLNDHIHGDRSEIRALHQQYRDKDWDDTPPSSSYKSLSKSWKASCYHSHPALKMPGSEAEIYGGSCLNPAVADAEIYIGFDSGMRIGPRHWPWKKGHDIKFEVSDMQVPKDIKNYRKLVEWTKTQIDAGKKVHAGCIGGHGRTGMFLAALVSLYGEKDAISYVRKNYCDRAVESKTQVEFLAAEFGITPVGGSKVSTGIITTHSSKSSSRVAKYDTLKSGVIPFRPLEGEKGIWS